LGCNVVITPNCFAASGSSTGASNRRIENRGGAGPSAEEGDTDESFGGSLNASSSANSEETVPSNCLLGV